MCPMPQHLESKYQRNAAAAAPTWKADVAAAEASGAYCAGIQALLGEAVPECQSLRQGNWASGLDSVSAAEWGASVSAAGDRWGSGYAAAFTGGAKAPRAMPRKARAREEY
ncbi:MAG: hypothetical protein KGJ23_08180 [Euryarchaeota archaeon]|nr:hypothetical protein [Euryarchaeota archaeon]MDE1836579.1 hypothetical protein [Euryarchaeota archaeon]MDE1879226.1 hypothetical protein [Euryarchaeota archaeon]MDE2044549.1 hypothetical protein [Thermoplasmata archaeon]